MIKRLKKIFPYLKGSYPKIFLSLFFALLSTGSKLAIPFLAGKVVNFIASSDYSNMHLYVLLMTVFLVVGAFFRYLFDFSTSLIGADLIYRLRKEVFHSYNDVSIASIDKSAKGDRLLTLTSDIEKIQNGLVSGFAAFYDGVIAIAITLVFMAMINYILAILVVVLTPLSMLISRFISRFNSKYFKSQAKATAELNAFSLEELTNSEAITSLGLTKRRSDEFEKLNESLKEDTFKANLGASLINPSTRLVNALINSSLILLGALFIIKDFGSHLGIVFLVGDLSAFLTYASNYMQPFNEISDVISEIDYAFSSLDRVDEALHEAKDVDNGTLDVAGSLSDLSAENVTFSYDMKRDVIKDFTFKFKDGDRIALVGPTGCGKSTLINLLLRFYDPQKGTFKAGEDSFLDIKKDGLRKHIGMVLQDTWIFKGTVFENIAYAKEGATLEEVKIAAHKAQCDKLIERLPQGYDTMISDSSGLSIGEKQLICVARVMLLSPEIVILDEATSNIDLRTERMLNESFKELMKGRTSLVVAHRLSTIVSSDVILVMKDGEIIESGSHSALLAKGGFYSKLYGAQFL